MSKLAWDDSGNRLFAAGVDRGVIFPRYGEPEVWNGLTSIAEAPSDVSLMVMYYDGQRVQESTRGQFVATINAFTYPEGLEEYDGSGNLNENVYRRSEFNLTYRTLIGNDVEGTDFAYQIHLVYNAMVSPFAPDYNTINAGTDTAEFSWNLTTRPVRMPDGIAPSAHLIINTAIAYSEVVSALENILYGTSTTRPRFPSPEEIFEIFEDAALVIIIDHGDGTWTATGPDSAVHMLDATEFEISYSGAVYIDDDTYTLTTR